LCQLYENEQNEEAYIYFEASDDLHSLIRCARELVAINHRHFRASRDNCAENKDLIRFWNEKLSGKCWTPLVEYANNCNYSDLKKCFVEDLNLN
jgi:hypothetical protein